MKDVKKLDGSIYLSLDLSYCGEKPPEIFQAFRDKNMSTSTSAGRSIPEATGGMSFDGVDAVPAGGLEIFLFWWFSRGKAWGKRVRSVSGEGDMKMNHDHCL